MLTDFKNFNLYFKNNKNHDQRDNIPVKILALQAVS